MQLIPLRFDLEDADFDLDTEAMLHIDGGYAEGWTDGYSVRLIKMDAFLQFDDGKTKVDIGWQDFTALILNPPNEAIELLKESIEEQIVNKYWETDWQAIAEAERAERQMDINKEGA